MDTSRMARPLLVGAIIGLIIGVILGLIYAYRIDPLVYAGGAWPNELSEEFQQTYVASVAGNYLTTGDVTTVANQLRTFEVPDKVRLLANVARDYTARGLLNEADGVGNLARDLQVQEQWQAEEVSAGLQAAGAEETFANKLGQAAAPAGQGVQPAPDSSADSGGGVPSLLRTLLWLLLLLLIIAAVVILAMRLRGTQPAGSSMAASAPVMADDGSGLRHLRNWSGSYTMGQDSYDESFTVETGDGDFLGECGMGIMEGFASGSPKKVAAFDVWLFDKTDIRTVSMPIMSKFAFEDEVLRSKLPPDATPILAAEGQTFEIETTALIVKAKIDEVGYGEGQPEMSYFNDLKVSLTAYLKPNVDVSGSMPIPEGYESM